MQLRSLNALALALLASLGLGSGACRVNVDYSDTAFACTEGECPSGFSCQSEVCVPDDGVLPGESDAAVDAEVPDASLPDAQALAACDDSFAAAPGYELCSEDEASCSFNYETAGGTCADACTLLGTTCLGAFDNNAILCEPVPATGDTCDTPRQSEICVCARLPLQ